MAPFPPIQGLRYTGPTMPIPTTSLLIDNTTIALIKAGTVDQAVLRISESISGEMLVAPSGVNISTAIVRYGPGSIQVDGSLTAVLSFASDRMALMETTVEMWAYPTLTITKEQSVVNMVNNITGQLLSMTSTFSPFIKDVTALYHKNIAVTPPNNATNVWNHIVLQCSYTNITMFGKSSYGFGTTLGFHSRFAFCSSE